MGRTERCPACRRPMPRFAATCPSCGAGDGLVLESAMVEGPDGRPAADVELGGARRRWVQPALVAGVALAVGIGAVATSGGGGALDGAGPATTPAGPTTTLAGPSTTAVPSPTTTVDRDRFSLDVLPTPMLGIPTGAVLYGLSDDAEVVRIDVDAGQVSRRRLRGPRGERADGFTVLARDGVAVLASPGGRGSLTVPDGPATDIRWVSGQGARILPAASPSEIWRLTRRDDGTAVAERLGLDGEAVADPVEVPASATVLGDDGTGRLVAKAPGGTYLLDASGIVRVADGEPLAWSATQLVVTSCDATLTCAWTVIDRATGAGRQLPVTGDVRAGVAAALSPDGRFLAQLNGILDAGLEVVDLGTGERRRLDVPIADSWGFGYGAAGMWWSPTGSHLFWLDAGGRVNAWVVGGEPVVLDARLPLLRSLSVAPAPSPTAGRATEGA